MRHNEVRDVEAGFLADVCKDVKIEPGLLPLGNTPLTGGILADNARLDVSAVGIYSPLERTFLDVRVSNFPTLLVTEIKPLS